MRFLVGHQTSIGKVKARNEDSYLFDQAKGLFILCDGMGGHARGDYASQLACDVIKENVEQGSDLKQSLLKANEMVISISKSIQAKGMGTTAVVIQFSDHSNFDLAWVGDSRCYQVNQSGIEQLSEDHSYVGALLKQGFLTEEEAMNHPYKSVLLQAVGGDTDEIEPGLKKGKLEKDNFLVLCSDGLSNEMSDEFIFETIKDAKTQEALNAAVNTLIEAANQAGGHDNISVVVIRQDDLGA